jgi:hypothetical protein
MKQLRVLLALILLSGGTAQAETDSPAIAGLLDGAADLGRVNGAALACGYSALVEKAKAMMILRAPKTRRFGEAFENASNESFAAQTASGASPCPEPVVLELKLEMTELRMQDYTAQATKP